jgi:uncharacterized protein (DUF1810 family)
VGGADPFNLQRFVDAQSGGVFEQALAELRQGRKTSHWMWFIFPQHADLGRSANARYYGLSGVDEARAYLQHPVLGRRLAECCQAVLPHLAAGKSPEGILGEVDARKLRSSMEIFAAAGSGVTCFDELLDLLGR